MSDQPPWTAAPSKPSAPLTVGFLSVQTDSAGVCGGYLLTNGWGRPLEFRLSSAVQPTRVQQILYGPTLTDYLHSELIGKTLVEKTSQPPGLIVTDTLAALGVGEQVGVFAVSIAGADGFGTRRVNTARASVPLAFRSAAIPDLTLLHAVFERLDPAMDLIEPFARIREAMTEARKGGTPRAA